MADAKYNITTGKGTAPNIDDVGKLWGLDLDKTNLVEKASPVSVDNLVLFDKSGKLVN